MPTIESSEFNRSSFYLARLLVSGFLFGIAGAGFLIKGETIIGILWLVGSIVWFSNYFWSRKTPYIQITNDDIKLFYGRRSRPRILKFDIIQGLNVINNKKFELILSNGQRVKMSLSCIEKNNRDNLIQILNSMIRR